ncbi:MAG: hypothetical protein JO197_22400 [Acidobacteria bacterium]|nr:hypothetical protein [Acidobacteriota bacterium]MBV9474890.1 hypothetical protein [Acidobacteriota bacterium]
MQSRAIRLIGAAAVLWASSLSAQTVKSIELTGADGPLKTGQNHDLAIVVKTDTGAPPAQPIVLQVTPDAGVGPKGGAAFAQSLELAPGTNDFTMKLGTTADVVLTVSTKDGALTQVFPLRHITKVVLDQKTGALQPQRIYGNDLLAVVATGKNGDPAGFQKLHIRILGNKDGFVFSDPKAARSDAGVDVVTDANGRAPFSLQTGSDTELELLVTPLDDSGALNTQHEQTFQLTAIRTFDTFHSRRLYTELFMGGTFTNDYDQDGNSTGFNQTDPLVRATFDTIWYNSKEPLDRRPLGRSLFHTGIDMEVSSFPFGDATKTPGTAASKAHASADDPAPTTDKSPKGLENAFSGTYFMLWQPERWSSYTQTSMKTGVPTDALRLGVFTRTGLTTRQKQEANGDTTIYRAQIGFRFTQHQTAAETAETDVENIVPLRFVELSYGRFEQFANERDANRIVVDAGTRFPGFGGDAIPFYVGLHINAGRGPDDIRIFAGFLFQINKLATLFQGGQ